MPRFIHLLLFFFFVKFLKFWNVGAKIYLNTKLKINNRSKIIEAIINSNIQLDRSIWKLFVFVKLMFPIPKDIEEEDILGYWIENK